ncbi:hypothetical protein BsWGS_06702 [Bradybaena similaris]
MPESPGNIEEIHNSLKASLNRGRSDLDQDVAAASKRVLLENISFQPASAPYSMQRDVLRSKYIPLNPVPQDGAGRPGGDIPQKQWQQANAMTSPGGNEKNGDCLPSPKVVLYPEERVKMEWTRMTRIGAGLVNMGNTCFFNSTLQCLTYTAPLVNYCFTNDHREKCKKKDFCMMCEIQNHIKSSLDCGGRSIKPQTILQKLRCIAKHMKWGRQEDAHEFLRFVVDHLQQSCLNGETKLDRFSKETTVINQIFGGYLRSQVTCLRCHAKSDTFDPFMDLSLDIKGVSTVEEALAKFVKPETLDNENAYKCPKCKNKVRAQKRFSIEKAPNVLTLQLNRFDFHHHLSGKINRFIKYPEKINLRSYMSQRVGEPIMYHLYGVLVHSGHSSEHGHYYSFVKSPSKTWYCMNDSVVQQAGSNNVFSADAYVLFYGRIKSNNSSGPSTPSNTVNHLKTPSSPVKTPFIGPTLPSHLKPEAPHVNGIHGKPTSEIGTPIKHGPANSAPHVGIALPKVVSTATPLPGTHSKISFPILTPLQKKQHLFQQQQLQKDDGKHIVLQIKHGNSTTMEKSPDGKSKVVNGDISKEKSVGLVPYNYDSDSEQENTGSAGVLNSVNLNTNQQKAASASLGVQQAAGDHSRGPACVQKLSFPSNGDGDSGNFHHTKTMVGQHVSASLQQTHRDIPSSSASIPPQLPTSNGNLQPTDLHAKYSSAQLPVAASSRTHAHKDLTSKLVDTHQVAPLSTTTSTTLAAAGKSGVMELPVVNMSSYADAGSTKVKAAGGNWLVQVQECAPSPHSSCSSSHSVNSTTEWTVESKDLFNVAKSSQTKVQIPDKVCINKAPLAPIVGQDKPSTSNKVLDAAVPEAVKLKDSMIPLPSSVPAVMPDVHIETKHSRHSHLETPATPVGISDKLPLLHSPSSSGVSDCGLRKDKKYKKKHKKSSECVSFERLRDDSSSRSDTSSKRKKKHKKDKKEKKYKKTDFTSSDSDSYDDRKSSKKSSVRKHSRTYSNSSYSSDEGRHKRRQRTSDSENGYEWVEKTIETSNMRDSSSNTSSRACVQSWNHHIKDDVAPRRETTSDKIKTTWDGSRSSAVSVGLEGASHKFGNSVLSWDGSKSHNDREVEDEERAKRKRHWSDDYNEEIDAGKTKKVKKHTKETFSSDNPFQQFHSMKHTNSFKDNGPSWYQDHSYHQHHDNYYHKSSTSHHPWLKTNNSYHPHNKHNDSRFKSYKPHSSTYA